jgi:starch synthase
MDQQKGIDIAVAGLRQTAALDWQAVILGTGDPLLESACRSLEAEFPERVRALIRFDSSLSRRMYAAGDILLMPSRYEPCGLAQMIAMNYGCVPLARATGGLIDTICDDPTYANSTGFLFNEANPAAFSEALQRALFTYQERNLWEQIQKRGMQMDFGWEKPAAEYARLYQNLLGGG